MTVGFDWFLNMAGNTALWLRKFHKIILFSSQYMDRFYARIELKCEFISVRQSLASWRKGESVKNSFRHVGRPSNGE